METKYPKIALQGTDGLLFVRQHDILYAIADGNYTQVYLSDKRQARVLRKLKEVGQLLPDENFIRIHRSHLINLEHVVQFNAEESNMVTMSDGEMLPVARNRKNSFIEKFTRI
jgi:two-component system LytT family response regulator